MEILFQNDAQTAFLGKQQFSDQALIERCVKEVENLLEIKPEIQVFGKIHRQPRNVGFFSDTSVGYKYSKRLMKSKPLGVASAQLLATVNHSLGADFNGILVNQYNDGNDNIGKHSDDEKGLEAVGVVAISYGTERIFRIRDKITNKIVCDIPTTHGSILQMGGIQFQSLYTHEIPVQKKVTQPRISFTFRKHST